MAAPHTTDPSVETHIISLIFQFLCFTMRVPLSSHQGSARQDHYRIKIKRSIRNLETVSAPRPSEAHKKKIDNMCKGISSIHLVLRHAFSEIIVAEAVVVVIVLLHDAVRTQVDQIGSPAAAAIASAEYSTGRPSRTTDPSERERWPWFWGAAGGSLGRRQRLQARTFSPFRLVIVVHHALIDQPLDHVLHQTHSLRLIFMRGAHGHASRVPLPSANIQRERERENKNEGLEKRGMAKNG